MAVTDNRLISTKHEHYRKIQLINLILINCWWDQCLFSFTRRR